MQADVSSPMWSIGAEGARVSFHVPSTEIATRLCDSFKAGKQYELTVKEKRKRRSMDANALMWAVLGEMSEILRRMDRNLYPEEIYRQYIVHSGNYYAAEVWEDEIERLCKTWASNGIGWVCEKVDICDEENGMLKYRCHLYYGSSQYDTKQMAQLIDSVLQDARALGVDTASDSFRALCEQFPGGQ